jgi:uncharacterized protein
MTEKNSIPLAAAILTIGFLLSVFMLNTTWRSQIRSGQTINVTGSAKKEIVSDFGILKGTLSTQAFSSVEAYKSLQRQKPLLVSFIKKQGFSEEKIKFSTISQYPIFEYNANGMQTNNVLAYVYSQRIEVESQDVNKIQKLSLDITSIIEQGVNFAVDMPEYHYSKMSQVKVEIQAEAAKDALIRAQKIAEATDGEIGNMRSARMGILQITPKHSNMISDYGVNDLTSIEKEITAVVNASFEIK